MTSDASPPRAPLAVAGLSVPAATALPSCTLGRTGMAALALGLVVLLVIAGSSLWLSASNRAAAAAAAEASRLRLLASDLSASLVDAETGQRGFLLTNNPAFLEPYDAALRRLPGELAALRAAARTQPRMAADVARLAPLVPAKFDDLRRSLALAASGDRPGAVALVATGRGKAVMDGIRVVTASIAAREQRMVLRLVGGINRRGNWLVAIDAAGIVLVLVVTGLVGLGLRRTFAALRAAGSALGAANAQLGRSNETLEATVRARTAALSEANEEIQRFAYIVSHDLRAPLVNVMGFTSELEAANAIIGRFVTDQDAEHVPVAVAAAVRDDLPEAIGFIKSSTAKMDRLIGAILKLSREGRRVLAAEPVAMGALLADIAANLAHLAEERGADITIGDVPDLVTDRLAVEQVFGNLAENALKYLQPGRPGRIAIEGRRQGAYAWIEVRDNGRGIAPRDHERVFELFRRAGDQSVAGEGIGLAHVRALVRRLGGRIDCQSRLGEGSTFRVILPLAQPSEKGAAA